jgi:hypothetical protein
MLQEPAGGKGPKGSAERLQQGALNKSRNPGTEGPLAFQAEVDETGNDWDNQWWGEWGVWTPYHELGWSWNTAYDSWEQVQDDPVSWSAARPAPRTRSKSPKKQQRGSGSSWWSTGKSAVPAIEDVQQSVPVMQQAPATPPLATTPRRTAQAGKAVLVPAKSVQGSARVRASSLSALRYHKGTKRLLKPVAEGSDDDSELSEGVDADEDKEARNAARRTKRQAALQDRTYSDPPDFPTSDAASSSGMPDGKTSGTKDGKTSLGQQGKISLPEEVQQSSAAHFMATFKIRFHSYGCDNTVWSGKTKLRGTNLAALREWAPISFLGPASHQMELSLLQWDERFGAEAQEAGHIGTHSQMFEGFCGNSAILPFLEQLRDYMKAAEAGKWDSGDIITKCRHGKHRSVALATVFSQLLMYLGYNVCGVVHHSRDNWSRYKCGWKACSDCDNVGGARKEQAIDTLGQAWFDIADPPF